MYQKLYLQTGHFARPNVCGFKIYCHRLVLSSPDHIDCRLGHQSRYTLYVLVPESTWINEILLFKFKFIAWIRFDNIKLIGLNYIEFGERIAFLNIYISPPSLSVQAVLYVDVSEIERERHYWLLTQQLGNWSSCGGAIGGKSAGYCEQKGARLSDGAKQGHSQALPSFYVFIVLCIGVTALFR